MSYTWLAEEKLWRFNVGLEFARPGVVTRNVRTIAKLYGAKEASRVAASIVAIIDAQPDHERDRLRHVRAALTRACV